MAVDAGGIRGGCLKQEQVGPSGALLRGRAGRAGRWATTGC